MTSESTNPTGEVVKSPDAEFPAHRIGTQEFAFLTSSEVMLLAEEHTQRTNDLGDRTGGFILSLRWGETKVRRGTDVVVLHSL